MNKVNFKSVSGENAFATLNNITKEVTLTYAKGRKATFNTEGKLVKLQSPNKYIKTYFYNTESVLSRTTVGKKWTKFHSFKGKCYGSTNSESKIVGLTPSTFSKKVENATKNDFLSIFKTVKNDKDFASFTAESLDMLNNSDVDIDTMEMEEVVEHLDHTKCGRLLLKYGLCNTLNVVSKKFNKAIPSKYSNLKSTVESNNKRCKLIIAKNLLKYCTEDITLDEEEIYNGNRAERINISDYYRDYLTDDNVNSALLDEYGDDAIDIDFDDDDEFSTDEIISTRDFNKNFMSNSLFKKEQDLKDKQEKQNIVNFGSYSPKDGDTKPTVPKPIDPRIDKLSKAEKDRMESFRSELYQLEQDKKNKPKTESAGYKFNTADIMSGIEEMADKMGIDVDTLLAQIQDINSVDDYEMDDYYSSKRNKFKKRAVTESSDQWQPNLKDEIGYAIDKITNGEDVISETIQKLAEDRLKKLDHNTMDADTIAETATNIILEIIKTEEFRDKLMEEFNYTDTAIEFIRQHDEPIFRDKALELCTNVVERTITFNRLEQAISENIGYLYEEDYQ